MSPVKEENGWRIAYVRTRDTQGRLEQMFGYSIGPRGVEPRLRFDVAPPVRDLGATQRMDA